MDPAWILFGVAAFAGLIDPRFGFGGLGFWAIGRALGLY
jgi:hypothetical protein